jgi:hypothetical protein
MEGFLLSRIWILEIWILKSKGLQRYLKWDVGLEYKYTSNKAYGMCTACNRWYGNRRGGSRGGGGADKAYDMCTACNRWSVSVWSLFSLLMNAYQFLILLTY